MQQGQEAGTSWTQELNQDSLITDAGSNYLDTFAGLGNDFDTFDAVAQHHAHSGLDTPMSRLAFGQDEQLHVQALEMHRQRLMSSMDVSMADLARMAYPQLPSNEPVQGYSQYPLYSQISHPCQQQVPLTPISTEMQATQYKPVMESVGQMIFDRQNASFTPLVSPAQTPVENAWNMPEYVMADEFFSPLTSPAIEAQQQQYTPTNATSPPVEFTRDASLSDRLGAVRKSRRKLTPTSRTSAPRSVRQSPATKPLTRRRQPNEAVPENGDYASASQLPSSNAGIGIGSDDSVSPEAFSEMLMRPPPVPSSRLSAATVSSNSQDENAPVTPATLMKMPAKQTVSEQSPALPAPMEDIALPAAMTSGPQILPQLDTKVGNDSPDSTPVVSAKTPKLSVDSTPRSTAIKTINASTEDLSRIARGGRLGKKRQSISSAAISPALRPKISPSISPLVPSSTNGIPILSAESSTLYLASKSNYQNIIDGTHLPGVSYPENLAENLNSKRTSHKLAEQGRRHRINLALKEVESLLPPSIINANKKEKGSTKEEAGDSPEKPATSTGTSKANTVEMAIVYIKSLQAELKLTQSKLEAAEKLVAEGSARGSQTSD